MSNLLGLLPLIVIGLVVSCYQIFAQDGIVAVPMILLGLTALWLLVDGIKVGWSCGNCGKLNETSILGFIFQMCDHQGLF